MANKTDEANNHFIRVENQYRLQLKKDPRNLYLWFNRGDALERLGMFDDAIRCYDYALEIHPTSELTWGKKSVALANRGWYSEAELCADKALELNPNYAHGWTDKG